MEFWYARELIPLNFLPPYLQDDVTGEIQPLVKYDHATGEPSGITDLGRSLLTMFQSNRGS